MSRFQCSTCPSWWRRPRCVRTGASARSSPFSPATVRARRADAGPPVRSAAMARAVERAIRARLGEVARDVVGLEIRLTYDDAILRGRIARVELRAARATVGDLTRRNAALARVRDLQIGVDDLLVNPFSAYADG